MHHSVKKIVEIERKPSSCEEPHAIATDGKIIWVSSRATRHVDVIDGAAWRKIDEIQPPTMAWGMAYGRGDLFMTCGDDDTANRRILAYRDGNPSRKPIDCPEGTGSHLSIDGERILLGQWYLKKIHMLSAAGDVIRTYDTPHEVCGVAAKDGEIYVLGTDDEDTTGYFISAIDLATGAAREVAAVSFRARGLAWDGASFWTNHREADQTVRFALPG